jgi:hypothetical protein
VTSCAGAARLIFEVYETFSPDLGCGYALTSSSAEPIRENEMRHAAIATGIALLASMFALAPASAEFGGPVKNDQGQCRQYGANNQNLTYYHWEACPSTVQGPHGHVHVIRATAGSGGSRHHHLHG